MEKIGIILPCVAVPHTVLSTLCVLSHIILSPTPTRGTWLSSLDR